MFKRTLFSFVLGFFVFSASAFSETAEQKIIRESYEILNGDLFEFANPTTALPKDLFEKRIHPVKKSASFLSLQGVSPGRAIESLFDPQVQGPRVMECNTAASLVRLRLLMARLGGVDSFDSYLRMQPLKGVVFSPRVVLGNPDEHGPYLSAWLFKYFTASNETKISFEQLPSGATLSVGNHPDYLSRHFYGNYMAENVVYYGKNDQQEPLFYGFKGLFLDQLPHTLLEIRRYLMAEYLKEPTPQEQRYSDYYHAPSLISKIQREVEDYQSNILGDVQKENDFAAKHTHVARLAYLAEENVSKLIELAANVQPQGCSYCGKAGALARCGGTCTEKPSYCEKKCQLADWARHKKNCGKKK